MCRRRARRTTEGWRTDGHSRKRGAGGSSSSSPSERLFCTATEALSSDASAAVIEAERMPCTNRAAELLMTSALLSTIER